MTRYKISAYNEVTCERMELFTWTRSPETGILRAKNDAKNFRMDNILSDYRAEPIGPYQKKTAETPTPERTAAQRIADAWYYEAYSGERYGEKEWAACAKLLLERGFTEEEAVWVLRSKWMRWAADSSKTPDSPTADDLATLLGWPGYDRAKVQHYMAND